MKHHKAFRVEKCLFCLLTKMMISFFDLKLLWKVTSLNRWSLPCQNWTGPISRHPAEGSRETPVCCACRHASLTWRIRKRVSRIRKERDNGPRTDWKQVLRISNTKSDDLEKEHKTRRRNAKRKKEINETCSEVKFVDTHGSTCARKMTCCK